LQDREMQDDLDRWHLHAWVDVLGNGRVGAMQVPSCISGETKNMKKEIETQAEVAHPATVRSASAQFVRYSLTPRVHKGDNCH